MTALKDSLWFYADTDDSNKGPISTVELYRLVKSGAVLPSTLVWTEGMNDWCKVSEVRGLLVTTKSSAIDSSVPPRIGEHSTGFQIDKVQSTFSSPSFYRLAGNVFGIAAVTVFIVSIVGYPFGLTWFSGSCLFGISFIVVNGIRAILEQLNRLSEIQSKPPSSLL